MVLASGPAAAAPIDVRRARSWLAESLEVLEDPSRSLTLAEVRRPEVAARFERWGRRNAPNFGFTSSAIWVRLILVNPTAGTLVRWLELDQPNVDEIRVFTEEQGRLVERVDGRIHPVG